MTCGNGASEPWQQAPVPPTPVSSGRARDGAHHGRGSTFPPAHEGHATTHSSKQVEQPANPKQSGHQITRLPVHSPHSLEMAARHSSGDGSPGSNGRRPARGLGRSGALVMGVRSDYPRSLKTVPRITGTLRCLKRRHSIRARTAPAHRMRRIQPVIQRQIYRRFGVAQGLCHWTTPHTRISPPCIRCGW